MYLIKTYPQGQKLSVNIERELYLESKELILD